MMRKEWALVIAAILFISVAFHTQKHKPAAQENLIRLHVIANSDSQEDQLLKYKVRDSLLLAFGNKLRSARTIDDARELIQAEKEEFRRIASQEIIKQGYEYEVDAQMGIYPFPTRVYGREVYPAGDYEALRVVIGEGKGANWWCVMFPPLCFVDVSSGTVIETDSYKTDGQPDYSVAGGEDNNSEINVEYTFKIAKFWDSFINWIGDIFP
ncbi:MAG: stage II sporulation protein R [Caldicoprobacterales bacterium]|jgi:stage II sporulation protein R